ncbi:MAG: MBL fold metallo-hydrolase, partial [Oscillospiraceae bacterium]|nr:MBL fold metallo-hydrolase [Oscillospiraceae bacterium]
TQTAQTSDAEYVLNTNSKKFHSPSCENAEKISEKNRSSFNGSREDLIAQGYTPCGFCEP